MKRGSRRIRHPFCTYTYNANNQLSEVHIPGHEAISYVSYRWNRPEKITLPGGSTRDYAYDPLMRVKRITSRDPEQNVITDLQYEYDRMSNITLKATEHGTYQYDYDELDRLIRAGNPTQKDEAFTYDSVGNRLASAGTTGHWTYNQNNELGEYDGKSVLFDANGNTVLKREREKVTRYLYNVEDRLAKVEDGSGHVIAEYDYDPFGRRLWKEVDGERTHFVYSEEGLAGECDDTGSLVRSYGYVPGSTWTTDPLFLKETGQYCLCQNDHLGTPQKLTAINGAVVWSAAYSSFGKAEIEIEMVENNLRFPGQYEDQETGLHYNWHRYYDPHSGRYLRPDPIGFNGGINLYNYSKNNSINLTDPKGLACGPGKFGDYYVPDFIFDECCILHDLCYEGNPPYNCDTTKEECDKDACECFKDKCRQQRRKTEIKWENGGESRPSLPPDIEFDSCMASAFTYCKAISNSQKSQEQFDKARRENGCPTCE